jgi:ATP-binding cassette subfamily F protein 1
LYEQHFEQEFKKWKQQQKQLKQLKHSGLTAKKALEKTQKQQKAKDEKLLGKKKAAEEKEEGSTAMQLMERPRLYNVEFTFPEPPEIREPIITVHEISFSYLNGRLLFKDVSFGITLKTRACIVGPNGSGKSTLMSLLTNELSPTKGSIERNRLLRVGKYHQHFEDLLPFEKTPARYLRLLCTPKV